jgi:hypothetical protein
LKLLLKQVAEQHAHNLAKGAIQAGPLFKFLIKPRVGNAVPYPSERDPVFDAELDQYKKQLCMSSSLLLPIT